ncbi:hypothetical protein DMA11_18155 [Marinilabiliaceae bacterium JC017]|nr:hypothetical protein DMA11_18155 [Marinilabiliaceae bacterium JC017]
MVELNFNPFGEESVFSFDHMQTKYWLDNKTALRLGIEMDYNKNERDRDDYSSEDDEKKLCKEKSFLWGIRPGIEFHILENSKVSPYWGMELMYRKKSSSAEYKFLSGNDYGNYADERKVTLSNAWNATRTIQYVDDYGDVQSKVYNDLSERAFYSLGANVLLGADFYYVKNMYFGFELGLGYEMINYEKISVETDSGWTSEEETVDPAYDSRKFGFFCNNSIRLGIWF